MILKVTISSSVYTYDLCLKEYSPSYKQRSTINSVTNGILYAIDYGENYDKWSCDLTVIDDEAIINDLYNKLSYNLGQVELQLRSQEELCGPGIDYTFPIFANVLDVKSPIVNFSDYEMSISLDILYTNNTNLSYLAGIPSTLPTSIAYQYGLMRDLNITGSSFQSDAFGNYGFHQTTQQGVTPNQNHKVNVKVRSNFYDASRFGKFYSTQRSQPFIWPDSNAPFFYPNQDFISCIFTNFKQTRLRHDYWESSFDLLSFNL